MEVTVVPFSQRKREICTIYKLKIKFYPLENNPQHAHVSSEDLEEVLELVFVRELEDSIQNEMLLLSRINGIKNFVPDSQSNDSSERNEVSSSSQHEANDDDDEDDVGNDLDVAEDLDFDMKKQKLRANDEMDYEDDSEEEPNGKEPSAGFESEVDQGEEAEITNDDMMDAKDSTSENQTEMIDVSKSSSVGKTTKTAKKKKKKSKSEFTRKDYDRAIFVEAKGNHFEVHLKFTNEPHILLTQVLPHFCCLFSSGSFFFLFVPFYGKLCTFHFRMWSSCLHLCNCRK